MLTALPRLIDRIARYLDKLIAGKDLHPAIHGRSLLAFLVPLPVFIFVVYGPALLSPGGGSGWRGFGALALVVGAITVQLLYFLQGNLKRLMAWLQLVLVCGLAVVAFFAAAPDAREVSSSLYRHYLGPVAIITMVAAVPVAWCLRLVPLFRVRPDDLKELTDGFRPERLVDPSGARSGGDAWDLARSLVSAVVETPLHVATPVALVILFVPASWLGWSVIISTTLSILLIGAGHFDREADLFLNLIKRSFLTGLKLVVTLVVLVFAALRLAGVSYVTTVLDASSGLTIASYVISTYALLWLFDFWVKQAEVDLLDGLRAGRKDVLVRHGGGRLIVKVGDQTSSPLDPEQLLTRIASAADEDKRDDLRLRARRTRERLRLFSAITNITFGVGLLLLGLYLHRRPQEPGLYAAAVEPSGTPAPGVDLGDLMVSAGAEQPVIMVAASGGGTRAALYTAGVLRGLDRLKKLDRVVALSSVSGGSAAVAYFAAFRFALVGGTEERWRKMTETLAAPYIEDVFAGASEWRIASGVRLGQLLTESFERRFDASRLPGDPVMQTSVGHSTGVGLLINTSLCGESGPREGIATVRRGETSEVAGGRLVVTNLRTRFDADATDGGGWPDRMPFRAIRDPRASLLAAASLSANFPPVFSNAAVNLRAADGTVMQRYWVTDGGAVENRGIISLLVALDEALAALVAKNPGKTITLPDVRLVVAEASAFDPNYKNDRGLGAKFGAAEQITNGYARALLASINARHLALTGRPNTVKVVYLAMPDALRAAGTFGTHWMMPPLIPFGAPIEATEERRTIELQSKTVKALIDGMFDPNFGAPFVTALGIDADDAQEIVKSLDPLPWKSLAAGLL